MLLNRIKASQVLLFAGMCTGVIAVSAEGKYDDVYPEQIRPCFEARDTFEAEHSFAELSGINNKDDTCIIYVMFKNQEMLDAFNKERVSRGLDPENVTHKGRVYQIEKTFGTTRH